MSKLARLIAQEEGFNVPGSVPNRDNNPGDLRHSPHSFHLSADPDGIGEIDTPADGWADLERQLRLFAQRGLTLSQMVEAYAPPSRNNTVGYLEYLCNGLGLPTTATVSQALEQL